MGKQLIVLNPCAGRRQGPKHIAQIRAILEKKGLPSELYETTAAGDACELIKVRAGEFEQIVCIGGDGTLNEVISGIIESGANVPIGYIPAGTTNDLAASHGLSSDLLKVTQDIVDGKPMPLDVGTFNGRLFVYTASFGAFTRASYAAPQHMKNAIGHLAYILEGVKDVTRIRPYKLYVEVNGESFEEEYLFGAVSNSTSMGGVLKLDPNRVDLHDGKFELLLVRKPEHIGQLVREVAALQRQNYEQELLRFVASERIHIRADAQMPWTLDGECQPGVEEIEIVNRHDAVKLIVPVEADA